MLSEQKSFLRVVEVTAYLGATSSIAFAFWFHSVATFEAPIELILVAGFALLMLCFIPVCMLGAELAQTVRHPTSYHQRTDGLNASELSFLLHWAPLPHKVAAVLGIVIALGAVVIFGSVSWSSAHHPTAREAAAGALYLSAFFLVSLPVVGSPARMPGTYQSNCGSDA